MIEPFVVVEVQPLNNNTWRVEEVSHKDNMVVLVSDYSPTIRRFGVPEAIDRVRLDGDFLIVSCCSGVHWQIRISDGSRRKVNTSDSS